MPAHSLSSGDHLNTTNHRGLALSQRKCAIAFFLLASSQLFPRSSCFFFGDLQFSLHLLYHAFGVFLLGTHSLHICDGVGASLAFYSQGVFEMGLALLCPFLLLPVLVEPSLELAFRRGAKALELYYGME